MINHLPALSADIEKQLISFQPQLASNVFGGVKEFGDDIVVIGLQVGDGLNVDFGDYQNMHRGLGMDVFEGLNFVVLKDNLRLNFTFCDFTEDTLHNFGFVALFFKLLLQKINQSLLGDRLLNPGLYLSKNDCVIQCLLLAEDQSPAHAQILGDF